MTVLTWPKLEERLNLPITDRQSLIITPPPSQGAFDADSVDLRLGTHFLMPQIPPRPFIDPGDSEAGQNYLHLHAPVGDHFVLPAHQTVLGTTLEFIKLPSDVSGEILTKSAVARTFMVIETAPWIHPGYRGCLTLEIANSSNTAIILYPGMAIGQLVLMQNCEIVKNAEGEDGQGVERLRGSFIGPVVPEAPSFKSPGKFLSQLGVSKYRGAGGEWVSIS